MQLIQGGEEKFNSAIKKVHLHIYFFGFQVKQNVSNTEHNSELITGVAGISQVAHQELAQFRLKKPKVFQIL